jgi:DNA-binding transcriptional regulator YiaG
MMVIHRRYPMGYPMRTMSRRRPTMSSAPTLPKAIVDSGLTHGELADWLGVSKSAVHKWASSAEDNVRQLPMPVWALLLLLTDQHPKLKLTKRR